MADNFTFLDATQATKTARAVDNSSVWLPATVLASADGTVIAADGTAAAGPIFPIAGVYLSSITEATANYLYRLRMNLRKVLMVSPDAECTPIYNSGGTAGAANGDMRSTTTVSYQFPDKIKYAKQRTILFKNGLDKSVTLTIWCWQGNALTPIYTNTFAAGAKLCLLPGAGGTGSSAGELEVIPALACPLGATATIQVTPATAPTSGTFEGYIDWRSM